MTKPLKRIPLTSQPSLEKRLNDAQDWAAESESSPYPWQNLDTRLVKGFALRMPMTTHAKVNFIVENTPRMSMHKFIMEAIEEKIDRELRGITERRKNAG